MRFFIRKYSCTFIAQAEEAYQADAAIDEVQMAMEDAVQAGLRAPAEVRIIGAFDDLTRELTDINQRAHDKNHAP